MKGTWFNLHGLHREPVFRQDQFFQKYSITERKQNMNMLIHQVMNFLLFLLQTRKSFLMVQQDLE